MQPFRLIDALGRIVLPLEIRGAGEEVILKRHKPTCHFYGAAENLQDFMGKPVCRTCRQKLAE